MINKNETDHDLTIGHCNIQGGLTNIAKSSEIWQLIRKYDMDILSLNETNLNDGIDSSTLGIPTSHEFIRKDRGGGTRGGCGLLINKNINFKVVEIGIGATNIEALWVKLNDLNIYVCGFYRSHKYSNVDTFLEYMSASMLKLKNKNVIWIGDINIDQNNINSPAYKKLDMTLRSFNMIQTIRDITRIAQHGDKITCTTLDVIFTNCYSKFLKCNVLEERIGDHQAIDCILDLKVMKAPKYHKVRIRDHSQRNIDSFATFLSETDYSQILGSTELETAAMGLNDHLNKYYDDFFPFKTIRKHDNYINKPSRELLTAIKLKGKLYKKFKNALSKVGNASPSCNKCKICIRCKNCDKTWENYKTQRNLVTKLSKSNKRQNIIDDLKAKSIKNDLKGIWKTIKRASNISPGVDNVTKDMNENDMNSHFATIGSKIKAGIPEHDNISFNDFLPASSNDITLDSFREISYSDVETYINGLRKDKSIFDKLPLRIFKYILPCIQEPLTHIINLSLLNGKVPSFCKYAQVTPIWKGGDSSDFDNYRPISILPIIGKCIEYFVSVQLTEYMENNNLFTDQQYGFRKNNSTTFLMMDLFDDIYESKSKAKKPGIIFLDIKKAFDTVDHKILLDKLEYYGIQGVALTWFKNFLSDRYQCTKIDKKLSSFLIMNCGVPQGSILGPILFSIYINDITNACHSSKPYLFADDGALLFDDTCRKSYINMKFEMITIMKWLNVNKLALNANKTNFMIFDSAESSAEINLGFFSITECKQTKYLGLMVDNKLTFNDHIEYTKRKVSKRIGAMYRSKKLLPIKYRKMFANALMLPQFDYLDIIYNKAGVTKLRELDIMYKKVAKIALDVPITESSLNVYKDMKWLPLHLRRQVHLASYMYRIINNMCPSNTSNKFSYINGGSRSGNNCNLYINKSKTHKDFKYLGAKCWNVLPTFLRNAENVKLFSKIYKVRLLNSIVDNDSQYSVNNAYDNFYELPEEQENPADPSNLPEELRANLRSMGMSC